MINNLPRNWAECLMGNVAKIFGGGTPPSKDSSNFQSDGGIPWITPADLSKYKSMYIARGARNLSERGYSNCSATKMPAETVLFSSRAPVGYVAIAECEVTTNQGFKSFVLPKQFNSRYVYYYLRHIRPVAESMATGTTFKELSGSAAAKLPLLVAPSSEQKRIADKLDSMLARVDACRDRLDRVPLILKRFRQSVLAAATLGELTKDWRAKSSGALSVESQTLGTLPEGWTPKKIGMLITLNPKNNFLDNDLVGFVPMNLMGTEYMERPRFESKAWSEVKKGYTHFGDGDVLLAKITPCFENGKAGIPNGLPNGAGAGSTEYFVCRPNPEFLRAEYLLAWFKTNAFLRKGAVEMTGSVGHKRVPKDYVLNSEIPLPSMGEQHEIVRRIEILFAFAGRLETRLVTARTTVDRLTPSLLAKAFRGELVAQDPNDEPAIELLKRLAVNRKEAPPRVTRVKKAA